MSEPRKTCAGCPHLEIHDIPMGGKVAACGKTTAAVPQNSKAQDEDAWQFTFWRVPMNCPLPDDQVQKSEDKAPAKDWVTVSV